MRTSPRTQDRGAGVRRGVRALAAGVALVVTGACASGGGEGSGAVRGDGRVKITWQAAPFGDREDDARKYLVKAFEKSHPDIDVEVVSAPTNVDTNRAGLTTQILGKSATPDVFNGDVAWAAQFAASGLVLPLGDHLPKTFWDRFDPETVQGASYRGTVYGVPLTLDQAFLYYRKDLLAKHKLPVPTTWEQVVEQSEVLREAGDAKHGLAWQGASYEGLTAAANEFLEAGGGSLVRPDGKKSGVGTAQSRHALALMKDLVATGVSPRGTTTFQEPQALHSFTSGESAFLRNWAYAYDTANAPGTRTAGKVGVTAMPAMKGGDGTRASTIGGWNVYVNPHTRQRDAALTFVTWLTSPDSQRQMAERSSTVPAVDSVRESAELHRLSPVLRASVHNDLVSRPTASRYYPQISQATSACVNSMLFGALSPPVASRRLADDIDAALAGRRL